MRDYILYAMVWLSGVMAGCALKDGIEYVRVQRPLDHCISVKAPNCVVDGHKVRIEYK